MKNRSYLTYVISFMLVGSFIPLNAEARENRGTAAPAVTEAVKIPPTGIWHDNEISKRIRLVRESDKNKPGYNFIKDRAERNICAAHGQYGGKSYVRFGYVDAGKCYYTLAGVKSQPLSGENARLVHEMARGEWIKATKARQGGFVDAKTMLIMDTEKTVKNANSPGYLAGPSKSTGAYYLHHGGLYSDKEMKKNPNGEKHTTDSDDVLVYVIPMDGASVE